jgi:hypothetical protein
MKPDAAPVINHDTTLSYSPHWKRQMAISGLGAIVTGIVMVVFVITKFAEGAWFVVLLIPCMVWLFFRVHHHYRNVARWLRINGSTPKHNVGPVTTILLVDSIHLGTLAMIDYAKSLGLPWKAVHIEINPGSGDRVREKWQHYVGDELNNRLLIVESPFRQLVQPLQDVVEHELADHPEGYVNIVMGHLVMDTYWEQGLHQNSQMLFDLALQNLSRVVVTKVPFQIHDAYPVHGEIPGSEEHERLFAFDLRKLGRVDKDAPKN